jgi:hypothetical protein
LVYIFLFGILYQEKSGNPALKIDLLTVIWKPEEELGPWEEKKSDFYNRILAYQ